ncbi:DUF2235 domain-containing protein [uncultured Roseibium sp.]|uniref:T6SS phospholipase effector Tle1-like catalytic domain-containing protein n=1 Tax=uncultured Roseibium sp. TaxID=1936171 RepID=UPI0032172800
MGKNIVILCDGTSNEVSADRTNILRLFGTLEKNDRQVVFYDPGVGTFGAENSVSYYYRKAVEIWGLATGWGLDVNVKEAYRFVVSHYDPDRKGEDADRLYLFGFSRGAYTARVLAGFIRAVGLIPRENLNLLDYAYRAYKDIGLNVDNGKKEEEGNSKAAFAEINLYQRILQPKTISIKLLGLFDTVGSVIESGRYGPRLRSHAFTRTNTSVEHVRHALAIHERRTMFQPQLWSAGIDFRPIPFTEKGAVPQDVKEVWFSGVHGDIGGGYREKDSGLAKVTLEWMIEETKPFGLLYKTKTVNDIVLGKKKNSTYVGPDAKARRNESMNPAWSILEIIPRKRSKYSEAAENGQGGWYIPMGRARTIPEGAWIHKSVKERFDADPEERPKNLPPTFNVTAS